MLGWTRRINWRHWNRLKMLAIALVALTVFPVAAAARPGGGSAPAIEDEFAAPGGVTPTNLARAYVPQYRGVAVPDGLQAQPSVEAPLVSHDAPQLRRSGPSTIYVTDDSRSLDGTQVALGFGLGLVLATAAAIALMFSRGQMRAAHP